MGNNQPGRGDLGSPAMKSRPLHFHHVHSENIQISPDKRRAKRIESFCKGICFSDRPVSPNERVYIKFAEVSTSWSGVVRFGFTSHSPSTINPVELPRYACPDLTNKPGFWAKALPERFAEVGNVLFFYVTRNGDVMFGVNGEEKGVFFSGVSSTAYLWSVVDIYGNTTAMEFVGGEQLNNVGSSPPVQITSPVPATNQPGVLPRGSALLTPPASIVPVDQPPAIPPHLSSVVLPAQPHTSPPLRDPNPGSHTYLPLPFHSMAGRNIMLTPDKLVAVRHEGEYCNGYVFSSRPIHCGEKLAIHVLSVDCSFEGGLAFGMTACDPSTLLSPNQLPDDSDLLLDRPEYWVVNKDVCTNPEVGDQLCFQLTDDGEVVYFRNGVQLATLMHVDKTLPMWAFIDVYGSCQKIQSLGMVVPRSSTALLRADSHSSTSLTVALPPPRTSQAPGASTTCSITPPPRPPPPRASPCGRSSPMSPSMRGDVSVAPPILPPKQHRVGSSSPNPHSTSSHHAHLPPPPPQPANIPPTLPPPLIPTPDSAPPPPISSHTSPPPVLAPRPPPAIPQRHSHNLPHDQQRVDTSAEQADNSSNECSVCLDRPADCVIYTCGHMCTCYSCAVDVKNNQDGLCPICRQPIKDIIKIFKS